MEVSTEKIAQEAINAISERIKNLNRLNIIVAGKTGVGKSTLINAVFREKLAETGMGKPVTDHMRKITKKDVPIAIYDTRGFELGKDVQAQVKQEVLGTINEGIAKKDINERIHCIWYCINTASNRVEPEEIQWIRELSEDNRVSKVPIIVVLTQSFSKKNAETLRKMIEAENLKVVRVMPVLAEDYEIDEDYIAKSYGLEELIQVMGESLPDELLDTLQNLQIVSLAEKRKRARSAVAAATTAAALTGATPIPIADAALIIPEQISMIASITAIFGFEVNKSMITAVLSSTIGSGGATILGRTVVDELFKLIPGVGTAVGSIITATTAAVITAALGEAYINILSLVFNGEMALEDISTKKGKKVMKEYFEESLRHSEEE